ncbi:MAG: hemolysin family protein [Thermodesulfobacteriota bacterium]
MVAAPPLPLLSMDDKAPSSSEESPLLRRLFQFLRFGKAPDTQEELEQEIQELLEEGQEQGLITDREGEMIHSILEFRDTLVREIMTPRSEMVCADALAPLDEIIRLITERGFSRIPLYEDTQDNIVGIVHAKDLLAVCHVQPAPRNGAEIAKPALHVPDTTRVLDLLRDFQAGKMHMAIVQDEFGGVRGLVTLEDILEEIVGEISDEHDRKNSYLTILDDRTLVVDGKIDIEEVEEFFDATMPEGPYESVGGLIIHQLGRLPQAKESLEAGGLTFTVLAASNRRIKTVRVHRQAT